MARYLVDANLPRRLALWQGPDFDWVADHDDTWPDSKVWEYARQRDLIIVTKDADFSDRAMLSSPPPRIVHLRVGNMRLGALREFLIRVWPLVAEKAPSHKLLVVHRDSISGIV
jgi:predicted nuclease of predicted toxin-antitoxin system